MPTIKILTAALLTLVMASADGADAPPPPVDQPTGVALTAQDVNTWLDGYMPYALHTADIAGAVRLAGGRAG